MSRRTPSTPETRAAAAERWRAYEAVTWIPCHSCGNQKAGPLHRKSERLWRQRADRARENGGTDPASGVTLEDAERHLAGMPAAELPAKSQSGWELE